MKAVILTGGEGSRIWPYNQYRHKAMIPVGNKPILQHQIEAFNKANINDIIIVSGKHSQEIRHYLRDQNNIKVITLKTTYGAADSLYHLDDEFIVVYGDCYIDENDLIQFSKSQKSVLLSPLVDDSRLMICAETKQDRVIQFWGHPRGENWQYFASAFHLYKDIIPYLETVQAIFQTTKVGVGSPQELYLENALNDYIQDGHVLDYMIAKNFIIDIDKPWHIMAANHQYNQKQTESIKKQIIGANSSVSSLAKIDGCIVMGKESHIGDYVTILGNVIIGDYTTIENGAIIENGVMIGNHCRLSNHCKIGAYSSIGDECIIDQTAELLGGVLFSKVYLYHYGEYYGVIGKNTDIGAGTTVGTLRFDDGETTHYIKGKREIPQQFSNACFLGDYSRTGVGTILLPGCKVGCKSIVGSGVILNEDVEDETLIYAKQELVKKPWGDSKYGW